MNKRRVLKEIVEWAASILAAVIIAICFRSYIFAQTEVRQSSMQNTLFEGQRLIEYKTGYYYSKPKRGDIVIINSGLKKGLVNVFVSNTMELFNGFQRTKDPNHKRLIKRVIGLPGETLDIKSGKVYVNGVLLIEPYVNGETYDNGMKFPIKVAEDSYFVMGDNREVSMDSRRLGQFKEEEIEGRAIFRIWPFNKMGKI